MMTSRNDTMQLRLKGRAIKGMPTEGTAAEVIKAARKKWAKSYHKTAIRRYGAGP